jgi:hypothetical protein
MAELKALGLKLVNLLKQPVVSHTIVALAAKSVYSKVAVGALFALLGIS